MLHSKVFDKLSQRYPEAVMVRATLEQALPPSFVDEIFEQVASKQYTRKLLFSTLVRLLSLVVCRARSSVHSAIGFMSEQLVVNAKSVYNKLNRAEPAIAEAIVRESASRMAAVVDKINAPLESIISGYQTRILDGNHLAATEHRPAALRTIGGGALPGQALVEYDAERGMIEHVYLSEDGHAQERELAIEVLSTMDRGRVYIADRNFATAVFMLQTHANGSRFIVRRHALNGQIRETGCWHPAGECDRGIVDERTAVVGGTDGDESLKVRLVRVRLESKTRGGDREIELVTDLPRKHSASTIAEAYRKRWRIETAFAELDRVFEGEIESLAHPRAALLAFALAVAAFNALAVVLAAMRKKHGAEKVRDEVSTFHLGERVQRAESALDVFLSDEKWTKRYARMTPRQLANDLIRLAHRIDMRAIKKHKRGAKKPPTKRVYDKKHPHFSTHRVLEAAKANKATKKKTAVSAG